MKAYPAAGFYYEFIFSGSRSFFMEECISLAKVSSIWMVVRISSLVVSGCSAQIRSTFLPFKTVVKIAA